MERYSISYKLHFLGSNQITRVVILKVTIKIDQGTSTFGMHGIPRVKVANCL